MSEVNGLPRPPFFPNSKSAKQAKQAKDAERMRKVLEMRRNSQERMHEINRNSGSHTRVDIPDVVRDFSRVKAAVDAAPSIDNSEKVARLKQQIRSGNYNVDYDALADKLIQNEY